MKTHEGTVRPQISSQGVGIDEDKGEGGTAEEVQSDKANEVDEEVEEMEVRSPKVARKPQAPTRAEVEAHYPLHAECREWCPHCVAGREPARSTGKATLRRRR